MNREDVFGIIKEVVVEKLGVDEDIVIEDALFIGDVKGTPPGLGADSLYLVEIVMELEDRFKEFNLRIEDEDLPKIRTVKDAVDYIAIRIVTSD